MNVGVARLAFTLTLAAAAPVAGEEMEVRTGPRVRVSALAVSARPFVGRLVASDDRTVTILRARKQGPWWLGSLRGTTEETLRLPRESVTRFERSVRPSRKKLGQMVGAGVGVAVGYAIVAREVDGDCAQCGLPALMIAAPFAFLGGAVAPGDRWVPEDPRAVRVGFEMPVRSVGLRLAVRF